LSGTYKQILIARSFRPVLIAAASKLAGGLVDQISIVVSALDTRDELMPLMFRVGKNGAFRIFRVADENYAFVRRHPDTVTPIAIPGSTP
jgi:hypothetical protein